jgi:ERF superfamily
MEEKKNTLIEKIALAKTDIKVSPLKKEGKNKFSNYDYFTPSQIEFLVHQVCDKHRMLTKFDLHRDTLGVFGRLTIFDLDSADYLCYEMATEIPEIKATNIAQQLGGCMTYTERYLKTSSFGITDNNLDFDADKNEKPAKQETKAKPVLTQASLNKMVESIEAGNGDAVKKSMPLYEISTEQLEILNNKLK